MWAGSEVGEDSSAGRQQASVLRSVASLFFSLRLAALFPRYTCIIVYVGAIMVLRLLIILMFWIWGVAAGEGRRPLTGRRSRPSTSASRRFPVTGSLKLMTGHIVLVMSGWRYCDLMSLEQSDPSKIGEPDFFCNSSTTVHEKEYVLPIGTISCGGLVLPLYFVTLWCP
ncbi:uncharacterized protein [Triticum aestivum]|uniref:uncharacterized protein n=1 Tax=Triticum aestivum TaxID=4565 RepID=UPI001D00996B|nr:uncharacterized protein LOC123159729 [Triticum aestivum]